MSVNDKMKAIADAIRAHTGGTDALTLDAMAQAIAGIQAGGGGVDVSTAGYQGGASGEVTHDVNTSTVKFTYTGDMPRFVLLYTEDLDLLYDYSGGTYSNKMIYGALRTVITNYDSTANNIINIFEAAYSGETLYSDLHTLAETTGTGNVTIGSATYTVTIKAEVNSNGTVTVSISDRNKTSGKYAYAPAGVTYKWIVLW